MKRLGQNHSESGRTDLLMNDQRLKRNASDFDFDFLPHTQKC